MERCGLPASFHTGFSHWLGCTATTPQPLMRTGTFCCFRNGKDGQRPEHSGLMDVLSISTGSFQELCCFVFFFSHVVTNSAILVVDLLLQYDPNVYTTPWTLRTHPKVMKYPLPGRAEPLKMPAEWENTHCLVQGRFLWGEALTTLNEPTLKAAWKNKCPSTLRKSDLEEICKDGWVLIQNEMWRF